MVKKAPYGKGLYDGWLGESLEAVSKHINDKEDDWLILIIGETGSGKSNLGLHMLEKHLGKKASVDLIGLNKASIAEGLKAAKDQPLPRCFFADEANISKRETQSQFNKQMIDLYMAIRGLQIFHIWCNPSIDMLDKFFIEERLKGIYYCVNKEPDVRLYYYFRKGDLLQIFNKYGNLKLPLLYRVRKKYAYYRGWFKKYDGFLLKDYLKKKDSRMDEKIEEFYAKWHNVQAHDLIKPAKLAMHLGIEKDTVRRYAKTLKERGVLQEGLNYFVSPAGWVQYKITTIDDFENLLRERHKAAKENLAAGRQKMESKRRKKKT